MNKESVFKGDLVYIHNDDDLESDIHVKVIPILKSGTINFYSMEYKDEKVTRKVDGQRKNDETRDERKKVN